ncbi:MAG: hypothetical protein ACQSGP_13950, partial [Frankia sp.]
DKYVQKVAGSRGVDVTNLPQCRAPRQICRDLSIVLLIGVHNNALSTDSDRYGTSRARCATLARDRDGSGS